MVHLKPILASALVLLLVLVLACRCAASLDFRNTLVEANTFSAEIYDIELVAKGTVVMLAYKSQVLHIDDCAQWDGIATVGAYGMAFRQECLSIWNGDIQAKQWRDKWVQSTVTSPRAQFELWLRAVRQGRGTCNSTPVAAASLLPLGEGDTRTAITVVLKNSKLDWNALTDVHLDPLFGSQSFLTDAKTGTVTLCFDAMSYSLIGVVISASCGQTTITETIIVSAADGQMIEGIPDADTISEGTLYEEWSLIQTDEE